MSLISHVTLSGLVTAINMERRDVTIKVGDVEVITHFWTTVFDRHGAWRSGHVWQELIHVGDRISVNGYLGNNGRVVLAPQSVIFSDSSSCCVIATGKIENGKLITETPLKMKRVVTELSPSSHADDVISLEGKKVSIFGTLENNGVVEIFEIQEIVNHQIFGEIQELDPDDDIDFD